MITFMVQGIFAVRNSLRSCHKFHCQFSSKTQSAFSLKKAGEGGRARPTAATNHHLTPWATFASFCLKTFYYLEGLSRWDK